MLERLAQSISSRPGCWLLAGAVLTVLLLIPLSRARIDHSLERVLPPDDPQRIYHERITALFGVAEPLVVALPARPVAWDPGFLASLGRLTEELAALPEVAQAHSLTNTPLVQGRGETLVIAPAATAVQAARAQLQDARADPLLSGLVAADGQAVAIILQLTRPLQGQTVEEQVQRLEVKLRAAAGRQLGADQVVHLAGLPYLRARLVSTIERELRTIAVANAMVIIACLLALFRSFKAVVVALCYVVMVAVWVMGGMTLLGKDIDVYTGMVPSLILIIGVEDAIFILAFFQRQMAQHKDPRRAAAETVRRMLSVCLLTSVTTSLGFAAIVTSPVPIIRGAGLVLAVGILVSFVAVITLVPALLVLLPVLPRAGGPRPAPFAGLFERLAQLVVKRAGLVIVVAAGLVLLIVFGISRLRVESEFVRYFKDDDPVAESSRFVDQHLGGSVGFDLVFEDQEQHAMLAPARLRGLARLADTLRRDPRVSQVVALTDPLRALKGAISGRADLPSSTAEAGQLLLLLESEAGSLLQQLAAKNYAATRLRVRTASLPSRELGQLAREAEKLGQQLVHPGARASGQHLLVMGTADAIVDGQIRSLGLAALGLLVLISLTFGSLTLGLLAMIPNLLPIFGALATMAALGITLNNITAINAAVGLGIAVDDTIHFLARYRRQGDTEPLRAVHTTLAEVGRPILIGTLVLGSGFATLMLSSFRNNSDTGAIGAITLIFALLADLLVLPALLVLRARLAGRAPVRLH